MVAVLAAAVAGILERDARNALDRLGQINVMTFLDLLTCDDFDVTARTIIGLLGDRIAELILRTLSADNDIVQRILVEILVMRRVDGVVPSANGYECYSDERGQLFLLHTDSSSSMFLGSADYHRAPLM